MEVRYIFIKSVILFLLILLGNLSHSQDTTAYRKDSLRFNISYIKSGINCGLEIAASPARWNKKSWLKFGTIISTGALLYAYDSDISNFFLRNRTPLTKDLAYISEKGGNPFVIGSGLGSILLYGLVFKDQKAKNIFLAAARNIAVTGVYTLAMKHTFHRMRPYQSDSPYLWMGPFGNISYSSFPSGHTSVCFALATSISYYSENIAVPIVAYSLATICGLSRIHDNKHWGSDVWIGANLGFFISRYLNRR